MADPPAVENLLNVIVPHLKPGQIVSQSSTISASWTKLFAQRVEATGAAFLEAPFTGSKPAAEARKTVFYLGGTAELVEKARPVLKRLASAILHIGALGTASSLKLAMNLNLALMAEALSESLADQAGIPDDKFFGLSQCGALGSFGPERGEVSDRRLFTPVFAEAYEQRFAAGITRDRRKSFCCKNA